MRITWSTLALASGVGLVTPCTFAAGPDSTSNIAIYGIVDAGLVHESGGVRGSVNKLTNGANSMSRLGFRGSENLGGGLTAVFGLEAGIKIDTGELDAAGVLFNRFAFVGLKSTSYGTLTLGRQYTPYYTTLFTMADPFGTSLAGNVKNLLPIGGLASRTSNMVLYVSPVISGASVELAYTPGEQPDSDRAGRQLGLAMVYQQGPLHVRFAYSHRNNDVVAVAATATTPAVAAVDRGLATNAILASNYDFGFIKGFLAYEVDHGEGSGTLPNSNAYGGVAPTPSTEARDLVIGFIAPFGPGKLIASHVRKDDRTRHNQDAHQWGIGYQYPLSSRTLLYTSYAMISNKNGAGYTVGNGGEVGSGDRGFNVGLRHVF